MTRWILALLLSSCASTPPATSATADQATASNAPPADTSAPFYQHTMPSIDGDEVDLASYAGKVVLVVNVASRCGFTKQYEGLEALYQRHKDQGLAILGFPCDQFGNQEPGTEAEIKSFCSLTYGVSFPMFKKIEVNGPNAAPLYVFLREQQPGSFSESTPGAERLYAHLQQNLPEVLGTDAVKWNFTKFLVDRRGTVTKRFESPETPESIEAEIERLLAQR